MGEFDGPTGRLVIELVVAVAMGATVVGAEVGWTTDVGAADAAAVVGGEPEADVAGTGANSTAGGTLTSVPDGAAVGGVEDRFAGGAVGLIGGGSEVVVVRCEVEVEGAASAVKSALESISPLIRST